MSENVDKDLEMYLHIKLCEFLGIPFNKDEFEKWLSIKQALSEETKTN